MPINFIPNDPLAALPMRVVKPRPNRAAGVAGLRFPKPQPEGEHAPGTPEFLFWQSREAALLTIDVWEGLNGSLKNWSTEASDRKRLTLLPDDGDELNAFYDRAGLNFFHHKTGTKTTFSGASTDVVAHETGHALLDTLRPELFGSNITEHGAFHESFGDCMAVLVALSDKDTRDTVGDLSKANFVEALMEDLSDGVKRELGAKHPAAAPRHALNKFKFQLPTTLPTSGGPSVLTAEIHSFGRVFTGCFYDLIVSLSKSSGDVAAAVKTAGKLLIRSAQDAPLSSRFFQSVGRAMVLADQQLNAGANRSTIGAAFSGHGIMLGSASILMPHMALAGGAIKMGGKTISAALAPSTFKDLKKRIDAAPNARFAVNPVNLGGERMMEAVHDRAVSLSSLTKDLKGVVAFAKESVVLGASGRSAAVFSALPDTSSTEDEVTHFVKTLLDHDRIGFDAKQKPTPTRPVTHVIKSKGGQKVLTRIRYSCAC